MAETDVEREIGGMTCASCAIRVVRLGGHSAWDFSHRQPHELQLLLKPAIAGVAQRSDQFSGYEQPAIASHSVARAEPLTVFPMVVNRRSTDADYLRQSFETVS